MWPEWLWDVSPATVEIHRRKLTTDKRKDKPIVAAGRNRIVVWTSRPLMAQEKEMIPSFWQGWKVITEAGSQVAYERFMKRVEAEQAEAQEVANT